MTATRPVLFLDLDNVLITMRASFAAMAGGGLKDAFDPIAVALINKIIEATGAQIVLCTAHRDKPDIFNVLREVGLKGDFHPDSVTDNGPGLRGAQVQRWLDAHPEVTNYVIVDDCDNFLPSQAAHHVKPQKNNGLSVEDYIKALQILGAPKPRPHLKFRVLPTSKPS